MKLRFITALLLCLLLSACVGVMTTSSGGDIDAFTNDTMMRKLDAYAATVHSKPKNNAVAYAKDAAPFPDTRWSWAGYQGATTVDGAREGALSACRAEAAKTAVNGECRVYTVNGVAVK